MTSIKRLLPILLLAAPAWATNDYTADAHCVSAYNGETWATYLTDISGNNQDLQCTPSVNTSDFQEGDGSILFDPTTRASHISYLDDDLSAGWPGKAGTTNKDISIVMWIKVDNMPPGGQADSVLWKKNSWGMFIYNAKIRWAPYDGSFLSGASCTDTINTDTWYHVGVTFENSTKNYRIRVYDDDTSSNQVDATGVAAATMTIDDEQVRFGFGYVAGDIGYNFDGQVDDVAVFNDVLSTDEIDDCRDGTYKYAGDAACAAHWSFDSADPFAEDISDLTPDTMSTPRLDTTVYKAGTASMRFYLDDWEPAYRNDADLATGYPYKAGELNLEWSCTFWFRLANVGASRQALVTKYLNESSGSVGIEIGTDGYLTLVVRYGAASADAYDMSTKTINADTWYFVAASISAANDTYYLSIWDDAAHTKTVISGALLHDPIASSLAWMYGGMALSTSTSGINGWLDDAAIFDDIITPNEIDCIRVGNYPNCYKGDIITISDD